MSSGEIGAHDTRRTFCVLVDPADGLSRTAAGIEEDDLKAMRGLVGLLRDAGLRNVQSRTFVIERVYPLSASDEDYLLRTIFQDTWGERLRPYLSVEDFTELAQLCDPGSERFALRRPDFHFLQTFTLVMGHV